METVLLSVDSAFRNKLIYPKSSFFSYKSDSLLKNIKNIKLSSIELPNSFYNLTSLRNTTSFDLTLLEGNPGDSHTVTIPDGKYNSSLLISTIQTLLNNINISTDSQPTQLERYNFTIENSEYTQKIRISNPVGSRIISGIPTLVGGAKFTLTFPNNAGFHIYGIGSVFGYNAYNYTSSNSYTSENILNLYIELLKAVIFIIN